MTRRYDLRLWLTAAAVLAVASCSSHPLPVGRSDVFVPAPAYGWQQTFANGPTLTDGSTILRIRRGPVKIVKVTLRESGAKALTLGIFVRRIGQGRITYLWSKGFPTVNSADWAGAEPAAGATIAGPTGGAGTSDYELLIGYSFSSTSGTYNRQAVVITYQFGGVTETITHHSEAQICVIGDSKHPNPCP